MSIPLPSFSGHLASDFEGFRRQLDSWLALFEVEDDAERLQCLILAVQGPAAAWLASQSLSSYVTAVEAMSSRYGSSLFLQCQQMAAKNAIATRSFRDGRHAGESVAMLVDELTELMARAGIQLEGEKIVFLRKMFAGFPIAARMLAKGMTSFDHAVLQALTWEALIIAETEKSRNPSQARNEGAPEPAEVLVDPAYVFPSVARREQVAPSLWHPVEVPVIDRSMTRSPSIQRVPPPPAFSGPPLAQSFSEAFSHNVTPSLLVSHARTSSIHATASSVTEHGTLLRPSRLQRGSSKRPRTGEGSSVMTGETGEEGLFRPSTSSRISNFIAGSFRRRASSDPRARMVASSNEDTSMAEERSALS